MEVHPLQKFLIDIPMCFDDRYFEDKSSAMTPAMTTLVEPSSRVSHHESPTTLIVFNPHVGIINEHEVCKMVARGKRKSEATKVGQ